MQQDRLLQLLDGVREQPKLAVDIRELAAGLHHLRRELDDILVDGYCALKETLLDVEVHRLLIDIDGLVVLSQANMHLCHAQPSAGVLRILLDGVLELRQGFLKASPL